ncbi:GT4 family glycosyltransferase PelF [Bradyrhizobium sp. HKCCYLS20291]|uniref:GT4 family glycosyltransferase PelF n=1 Tax=Bradyrhizobium sp. HKCCYLS20291 TaxID=3420766 RepID=UPI003EC09DAA
MSNDADICMIVEGGYPYVVGGVASWADAFMRASSQLRFHIIAIGVSSQTRRQSYDFPPNVVGLTDIILDACPAGRLPSRQDHEAIEQLLHLLHSSMITGDGTIFRQLISQLLATGFSQAALLDSRAGWLAIEAAYAKLLPSSPLLDFFWSWRFLLRSVLAIATTRLPSVDVFHASATGFSGLVGSFAKISTGRPLLLTEHGIYTNERRIDLAVSEWLFDSGASGFGIPTHPTELRAIWLNAFQCISRISYATADVVTTQYRANQLLQNLEGAPEPKLRIIPNGIDADAFSALARSTASRRPTVLMIGRIVPIKDIRTFIMSIALLKDLVPDVLGIIIGPEGEDPAYAAGCRQLVEQLGVSSSVDFLGRVPDVRTYLLSADVLALSSISEAQPIAVLEAAATGLPVVSTDVGSCREIIEGFEDDPVKGAGGLVVAPCNPGAMAAALATILNDDDLRAAMGQVMRKRTATYYHKDRVKVLYEELYTKLVSNTSGAHA